MANEKSGRAELNPENYVFFIAHMYHMFGVRDEQHPWSIEKQWDFAFTDKSRDRIFGAIEIK